MNHPIEESLLYQNPLSVNAVNYHFPALQLNSFQSLKTGVSEHAEYGFFATFFIYNEVNAICVGLLEINTSCIQLSNTLLSILA